MNAEREKARGKAISSPIDYYVRVKTSVFSLEGVNIIFQYTDSRTHECSTPYQPTQRLRICANNLVMFSDK